MSGRTLFHLVACLAFALTTVFSAGCNKDDDVNANLDTLETTTQTLVDKVKNASDPAAGVADAQKYLDEHEAELIAAIDDLETVRGFQVGEETQQRMAEVLLSNMSKVEALKLDLMQATLSNEELDGNLEKLCDAYAAATKLEGE